jgi:RNA polymerase sigma-70 factor, ECF subfamily
MVDLLVSTPPSRRSCYRRELILAWRCTLSIVETADPFAHLLAQARRHDDVAVAALYRRSFPTIYRYVLARCQCPDLTEDIVAEVFLTMVESIGNLRATHEAGFFAWLLSIAHAKIVYALRQMREYRTYQQDLPESDYSLVLQSTDLASDPQALHEWREIMQELGWALGTLSETQQVVIIGRFLQGYSIEELALDLGKHPSAIRSLQYRALGALAERLDSHQ